MIHSDLHSTRSSPSESSSSSPDLCPQGWCRNLFALSFPCKRRVDPKVQRPYDRSQFTHMDCYRARHSSNTERLGFSSPTTAARLGSPLEHHPLLYLGNACLGPPLTCFPFHIPYGPRSKYWKLWQIFQERLSLPQRSHSPAGSLCSKVFCTTDIFDQTMLQFELLGTPYSLLHKAASHLKHERWLKKPCRLEYTFAPPVNFAN